MAAQTLAARYSPREPRGLAPIERSVWLRVAPATVSYTHLVSAMLGHYDAGFTLRTYTHTTRQKQDEAAQTMGNLMAQVR